MQTVFQRFWAKQQGQRHGHRAHLQHGHISHRGLKTLRQHNRHTVTALHAQAHQHMAQRIGRLLQLCIAESQRRYRMARAVPRLIGNLVRNDGHTLGGIWLSRPAAAAHLCNVEMRWH